MMVREAGGLVVAGAHVDVDGGMYMGVLLDDDIEDDTSLDTTVFEFTLEAGGGYGSGVILGEDGDSLLQEFSLTTMDPQANNAMFRSDILTDDIIDFSESNPWSEGRF